MLEGRILYIAEFDILALRFLDQAVELRSEELCSHVPEGTLVVCRRPSTSILLNLSQY